LRASSLLFPFHYSVDPEVIIQGKLNNICNVIWILGIKRSKMELNMDLLKKNDYLINRTKTPLAKLVRIREMVCGSSYGAKIKEW